ncbi:integrase catalytic domain-containing protein [Trichonephila clavipes]|uniref:Integrase catalytic domain-containing protein n=1 Tax=Trichonephila clavipes TaxID=2585209 RepID=A0A8X6UWU9_TRICX|nr:integrase catalytic domain-containing protein [Trichonephila clavipes]
MVWGGISIGGRTDLHIIRNGTLTDRRYADEILRPHVIPYAGAIGDSFVFQDDNARPHRAHLVENMLEAETIQRMELPACSPDLNPIEHVWDMLRRRIAARRRPPATVRDLEIALLEEWNSIPQSLIDNFIASMANSNVDKHSGDNSVLRIIWNLDNDVLKCCADLEPLTCEVRITKRLILSVVQKLFDPIGLLTPTTLLPKLLLQNLLKLKISWDLELSPNCKKEFLTWFKDTTVLKNVNIPRHLKVNISSELHVFVDAACVFVRSIIDSKVNIVLPRAKSRVAPLKPLSIPRLELMACDVGIRLVNSVMKALNFPNLKITFWSDSTTALWWIKEQGNWSVFVSNRVKEIRLLTKTHSWKHVPGNMNPADLLSRGCSPYKLLKSKWWEGPAWLKENSENWPTGEIIDQPSEIDVKRRKIKIVNIDLANDAPLLWHLHNISNYSKMIKVFGWILRFINNCRKPCDKCTEPVLSFYEIESSERCQRFKVKAMSSEPVPLPLDRVADCVAFEIVGIDLAVPLFLKSGEKTFNVCIRRSWRIDSSHTPATFLGDSHSYSVSDIEEVDSQKLSKRIKYRGKLFNDLRQRIRKEYLSELIQKSNEKSSREPKVGEIVLIGDDNKKRLFWPMARIIELIPGRDGKIRTVKLKTQHGTVLRPVQRVYPLEIRANENV